MLQPSDGFERHEAVDMQPGLIDRIAAMTLVANGFRDATSEQDNMKIENRDKDRRISQMRRPYEPAFSKAPNRMRPRTG